MRFFLNAIFIAIGIALLFRFLDTPVLNANTKAPVVTSAQSGNGPKLIGTGALGQALTEATPGVKAHILFLYASWCPYCRKQFPVIDQIAKAYEGATYKIIGLSVDQDGDQIEEYLNNKSPKPSFTTYQFDGTESVGNFLRSKGGHFRGGIPYIAVVDANGNILKDFTGPTPESEIKKALP